MCVCVCVLVCLFVFQCMGLLLSVYFTFYSYIIHFCHFLILATSECHFSFYVVFEKHGLAIKSVLLSCQLILIMQAGFLPFLVMAKKCTVKCINNKKKVHIQ